MIDGTIAARPAARRVFCAVGVLLFGVAPVALAGSYVGIDSVAVTMLLHPTIAAPLLAVLVSVIGVLLGRRWARTLFFYATPLWIVTLSGFLKTAVQYVNRSRPFTGADIVADPFELTLREWPLVNRVSLLLLVVAFVAAVFVIYRPGIFGSSDAGPRRRRRSMRLTIGLGLLFALAGALTFAYAFSPAVLVETPGGISDSGVLGGIALALLVWSYGLGSVAARFPSRPSPELNVPGQDQNQEVAAGTIRMAKAGFCSGCNTRVWLADDGSCEHGHSANCISEVYEAERPA